MTDNNLFAYGTLMSEAVFGAVTGVKAVPQPAMLDGFSCWSVKGEVYPAIVPDPTGRVDGVVYPTLTDPVWQRLDRYEGKQYTRRAVTVRLNDGTLLPALTYVWVSGEMAGLDRRRWRFDDFLNYYGTDYLKTLG